MELINKQRGPRDFRRVHPDRRCSVSALPCSARPGKNPLWPGLADMPGVESGGPQGDCSKCPPVSFRGWESGDKLVAHIGETS